MKCYSQFLAQKPLVVLILVGIFACISLIVPFFVIDIPDFKNPVLGFEARGTEISNRITSWQNLLDATGPAGILTVNPREVLRSEEKYNKYYKQFKHKSKKKGNKSKHVRDLYTNSQKSNESKPAEAVYLKEKELKYDDYFCGYPRSDYVHFVVSESHAQVSLFSLQSLLKMCKLEQTVILSSNYDELCITNKNKKCCAAWSLPNYIALIGGHQDCSQITEGDINQTISLLQECSYFYHNFHLHSDCFNTILCPAVPDRCKQYNIPYNILHFLTENSFLPINDYNVSTLKNVMVFLPIRSISDALSFYRSLPDINIDGVYISAMDFGIKYTLFEETILEDTWLIGIGALSVLTCTLLYTGSLFLTFTILSAMIFSLGLSYFLYTIAFNISFFPFMNLLAIVLSVGIGADDGYILIKMWNNEKMKFKKISNIMNTSNISNDLRNRDKKENLMILIEKVLRNASPCMFVTSLTTGAALYSLFFSNITAVRCFGVFSGTAVLTNYLVMMTWMPAAISCCENFNNRYIKSISIMRYCAQYHEKLNIKLSILSSYFENTIIKAVVKYRYFWMVFLSLVAMGSIVVVLYKPQLKLPDTHDFQLFDTTHPFEQYDLIYRDKFRFEEFLKGNNIDAFMPLRFVFGILPEDNGNFLNPKTKGFLKFDEAFNISNAESQKWLLNFCRNLRGEDFYQSTEGPLLSNCFIENFVSWMGRRCLDKFTKVDRSPCCEISSFPYTDSVFNYCLIEAMGDIYETPIDFFRPGAAGPKFSMPKDTKNLKPNYNLSSNIIAKALVVEYNSNTIFSLSYEDVRDFYLKVNNWTEQQIASAPETMKGWFISELDFYDLQHTLSTGTYIAIGLSMAIALMVLFLVTLNVLLSFYAILTVTCIIFTTVAILIFCGWKLNILESITISTAIGLAVDFSLHYSLHYRLAPQCIDGSYRENSTRYSLRQMCGPTTMAMLTTLLVGAVMLPSRVLAYLQIGLFLIVIMIVSWIYSTFFLGSLLYTVGPQHGFCQFSYLNLWSNGYTKRLSDWKNFLYSNWCLSIGANQLTNRNSNSDDEVNELSNLQMPNRMHENL